MALHKHQRLDDPEDELLRFPADDGIPMEDMRHPVNASILRATLQAHLGSMGQTVVAAGNNFIYYDRTNPRRNVGPDFYAVVGALPNPERDCWRVWNENGLLPQVIVEFLSKGSRTKDYKTNFCIYRDILKVPCYFIFDFKKRILDGWELQGDQYVPLKPEAQGRLSCRSLDLLIGFHNGWLRWFLADGTLIPTAEELVAEEAHQRQAAEARVAQLEEELRRPRGGQS